MGLGGAVLDTVRFQGFRGKRAKFQEARFCGQARHKRHICSESEAGGSDFVCRRVINVTFAGKVMPGRFDFARRRVTNDTFAQKVTPIFWRWSKGNHRCP